MLYSDIVPGVVLEGPIPGEQLRVLAVKDGKVLWVPHGAKRADKSQWESSLDAVATWARRRVARWTAA